MALLNLASGYATVRRIKAVPAELRFVALQAVNAPLAAEVERLNESPEGALARLKKLDAASAEEAISHVTNAATLYQAQNESRSQVGSAVLERAHMLGINLHEVPKTDRPAPVPATLTRTQRAVAKPVGEAAVALGKMATIDDDTVLEWSSSLGPDAPWHTVFTETKRHYSVHSRIIRDALVREVLEIEKLWDEWGGAMLHSVAMYEGEVNATFVRLLDTAMQNNLPVGQLKMTSLTEEARTALDRSGLALRHMCGVASITEVTDGIRKMLSEYTPSVSRYGDDTADAIQRVFTDTRDPEMADALAPLLPVAIGVVGDAAWRMGSQAAQTFLMIQGVSVETMRISWRYLGQSMHEVLKGEYGPVPSHDDVTWLLARYGDEQDEEYDFSDVLYRLAWDASNEHVQSFCERVLFEMPGGAKNLVGASGYGNAPLVELVMKHAGSVLGENVAAWSLFLQQVDSHDGLFLDLVNAAVIATANS